MALDRVLRLFISCVFSPSRLSTIPLGMSFTHQGSYATSLPRSQHQSPLSHSPSATPRHSSQSSLRTNNHSSPSRAPSGTVTPSSAMSLLPTLQHLDQNLAATSPRARATRSGSKPSTGASTPSRMETSGTLEEGVGIGRPSSGGEEQKKRQQRTPRSSKLSSTPLSVDSPSQSTTGPDSSPSKSSGKARGSRGKGRQASPPGIVPLVFPQSDSSPTADHISRTAPSTRITLPERHSAPIVPAGVDPLGERCAYNSSSADEWDMPVGAAVVLGAGQSLNWQQELSGSASKASAGGRKANASKSNRPKLENNGSLKSTPKARPSLPASFSDTTSNNSYSQLANDATSTLTWQQELLQQQPSSHHSQPQRQHTPSSTPVKNARHQQRDDETFGSGLSLANLDINQANYQHTPTKTNQHANGNNSTPRRSQPPRPVPQQSRSTAHPQLSTPVKSAVSVQRYAGPTFHNSPSAGSLPTPSFLLRRQAAISGGGV